ncbi:hypothetical protein Dimus_006683 [Dionaea muscipula]
MWTIWKAHNRLRFEGILPDWERILESIFYNLAYAFKSTKVGRNHSVTCILRHLRDLMEEGDDKGMEVEDCLGTCCEHDTAITGFCFVVPYTFRRLSWTRSDEWFLSLKEVPSVFGASGSMVLGFH